MKNITIAGGGVLGTQIAYQTAFHGYHVTVYDVNEAALNKAREAIGRLSEVFRSEMGATPEHTGAALQRLRYCADLGSALVDADLLIEAIPEVVEIKLAFYTQAGQLAPEKTIFATNTSTFVPSQFAASTGRPSRFLALHFANEIWIRNMAEVMGHEGTDQLVFGHVVDFATSIGMVPLPLHKEHQGYITNSLLIPWINAAMRMWADGVADHQTIDKTWMFAGNSRFVPFAFADMVGLNTAYNITMSMAQQFNDPGLRRVGERLKTEFIDHGKLGMSSGEGFYRYPNPAFAEPSFLRHDTSELATT